MRRRDESTITGTGRCLICGVGLDLVQPNNYIYLSCICEIKGDKESSLNVFDPRWLKNRDIVFGLPLHLHIICFVFLVNSLLYHNTPFQELLWLSQAKVQ